MIPAVAASPDTIVAAATASGRAALGIVRVSGPRVPAILVAITGTLPAARQAVLRPFSFDDGAAVDSGIVLHFPAPRSYTGEDMCEFHCHGNPLLVQALIQGICRHGARPALPGEFTQRAYLNDKIDLAQAEAVADLIDSRSLRAARSAMRTLQGEFSARIDAIIAALVDLRVAFEAAIDFPDDVPPEALAAVHYPRIDQLRADLTALRHSATQGARLNEGLQIAIVGPPNAGKSTLLNRLARADKAIVSDIPGTTRDVLETEVLLRDIPVRLFDTAGLRDTDDCIEQEGIRRAAAAMDRADLVLFMTDSTDVIPASTLFTNIAVVDAPGAPLLVVHNKIDRTGTSPARQRVDGIEHVHISARDGLGLELLLDTIQDMVGIEPADEGEFVARTRHLVALERAADELAAVDLPLALDAPELVAEILRRTALALGEISAAGDADTLLGEIFARFCIGK